MSCYHGRCFSGLEITVVVIFTLVAGVSLSERVIPPLLTTYPEKVVTFILHDNVTLHCTGTGFPNPSYYWTRNEDFIYSGSTSRYSQRDGDLFILPASVADEGIYRCWTWNTGGKDRSPPVNLSMIFLDHFPMDTEDSTHTVTIWDSITLPCHCPSSNPPAMVTWDRDDHVISADDSIIIDLEGNLHLISYEDHHDGVYTYKCYNTVMRTLVTGPSSHLTTSQHPASPQPVNLMWKSGNKVTVLAGETLTLQCIFSGSPPPETEWQRRNNILPSHAAINTVTLVIEHVTSSDQGIYECVAFNELSLHPVTEEIHVIIEALPVFESIPQSVNVTAGVNVTFRCASRGLPKPAITWFINGTIMENELPPDHLHIVEDRDESDDNTKTSSQLHVLNVSPINTMVISCVASNVHGNISKSSYMSVDSLEDTQGVASTGLSLTTMDGCYLHYSCIMLYFVHKLTSGIYTALVY